ncbi:hypothetical protein RCL1_004980 [Eukaryota sp. TZLM3-RCL]
MSHTSQCCPNTDPQPNYGLRSVSVISGEDEVVIYDPNCIELTGYYAVLAIKHEKNAVITVLLRNATNFGTFHAQVGFVPSEQLTSSQCECNGISFHRDGADFTLDGRKYELSVTPPPSINDGFQFDVDGSDVIIRCSFSDFVKKVVKPKHSVLRIVLLAHGMSIQVC